MLFLLLILLVAIPAFILYHFYLKRLHLPPGPLPIPIFGNGPQFAGKKCYSAFQKWAKEYGSVFTIWIGADPVVVITDYELMKQAFARDEFAGRNFLQNHFKLFAGEVNGLIRTDGEQWKQLKKFTQKAMRDYGMEKGETENQVLEAIYAVIDEVKSEMESGGMREHEVDRKVDLMTGSVINRMLFGFSFYGERYKKFVFLKDLLDVEQEYFISLISLMIESRPWLRHLPYFSEKYSENLLAMRSLFDFMEDKIKERIEDRKSVGEKREDKEDEDKTCRVIVDQFIDQMEQSDQSDPENYFKMKYLSTLCFDLFLAGQETTSNTINFLILFLMLDQKAQEKLHAELDAVWEQKLEEEEKENVQNLKFRMADRLRIPYTNAIVNESLRLANLLPLNLTKVVKQDVTIGGFKLRKGTTVINQISNVLFDEKIFPEPHKFIPERFICQKGQLSKKVEEMIAFGNGKRSCPGEPLGRMELLLFTANFFHKFHVYPPDPLNPPKFEKRQTFAVKLAEYKCNLVLRN